MIHRLEIENFYSIRERQIIDLRAAAHAPDNDGRLAPLWKGATEKAPKVVAFFGANASGKSNVLRALTFLRWFILNSFNLSPEISLPIHGFNSSAGLKSPSSLVFHSEGPESLEDRGAKTCRYAYQVDFSAGSAKTVLREGLYYWPSHASRRLKLFERDDRGRVSASKVFALKGYKQALEKVLRPNVSVISTLIHLGHPFSTVLKLGFSTIVSNILTAKGDYSDKFIVNIYNKNPNLTRFFNDDIKRIDVGIKELHIEQKEDGPVAWFYHEGLNVPVPLVSESSGTRQFMKLYPLINSALTTGGVAIIDDLDSSLHPIILAEILSWFHRPERNPQNAQFWISCHNVSLLESLIKEEVFFCEKDKAGQTHLFGLKNIPAVRRDDNYYKKYLDGFYGAIPQIG